MDHVSAAELAKYDVALMGEMAVDDWQLRMFTDWVRGGGNLIAMRPSAGLAAALGGGWRRAKQPFKGMADMRMNGKAAAARDCFSSRCSSTGC